MKKVFSLFLLLIPINLIFLGALIWDLSKKTNYKSMTPKKDIQIESTQIPFNKDDFPNEFVKSDTDYSIAFYDRRTLEPIHLLSANKKEDHPFNVYAKSRDFDNSYLTPSPDGLYLLNSYEGVSISPKVSYLTPPDELMDDFKQIFKPKNKDEFITAIWSFDSSKIAYEIVKRDKARHEDLYEFHSTNIDGSNDKFRIIKFPSKQFLEQNIEIDGSLLGFNSTIGEIYILGNQYDPTQNNQYAPTQKKVVYKILIVLDTNTGKVTFHKLASAEAVPYSFRPIVGPNRKVYWQEVQTELKIMEYDIATGQTKTIYSPLYPADLKDHELQMDFNLTGGKLLIATSVGTTKIYSLDTENLKTDLIRDFKVNLGQPQVKNISPDGQFALMVLGKPYILQTNNGKIILEIGQDNFNYIGWLYTGNEDFKKQLLDTNKIFPKIETINSEKFPVVYYGLKPQEALNISNDNLEGLRCHSFLFYTSKTAEFKDPQLVTLNKKIKSLVTAGQRSDIDLFCQTESGLTFLTYNYGTTPENVQYRIANVEGNDFTDIISISTPQIDDVLDCTWLNSSTTINGAINLTKSGILSIKCRQTKQGNETGYRIYQVDLNNKKSEILLNCMHYFSSTYSTPTEEDLPNPNNAFVNICRK